MFSVFWAIMDFIFELLLYMEISCMSFWYALTTYVLKCVEILSKFSQNSVKIQSKWCQNYVQNSIKFCIKLVTKDRVHMIRYMTQVISEYFHSFISAHKCYKYRKHTHHSLFIIPYKLVTTRSAQTNIKHFSKSTISLAIPVRSLSCYGCPPSPLDCAPVELLLPSIWAAPKWSGAG